MAGSSSTRQAGAQGCAGNSRQDSRHFRDSRGPPTRAPCRHASAANTAAGRAHPSRPGPTPMASHRFRAWAALVPIVGLLGARGAAAQVADSTSRPTQGCSYSTCALTIAPRWNGLAVVQGADARLLANLNFFWPRDVSGALGGASAASVADQHAWRDATRAVRLRRVGATLTDGGALLIATAAVRAGAAGHVRRGDGIVAAIGAGAFGLSVPFQFAADGMLSRAVWWHNARYAR
jgi:hypothetical protein